MKLDARRSRSASEWFSVSFTKQQAGFLFGGVFCLMAVSFSLGFLLAGGQAGEDPKPIVAANSQPSVPKPNAIKTTVVIPRSGEGEDGQVLGGAEREEEESVVDIRPNFYKALLKESVSNKKLNPIRLSAQTPGLDQKKSVQKLKKDTRGHAFKKTGAGAMGKKEGKGGGASKDLVRSRQNKTTRSYTIQLISVRKPARAIRILQRLRQHGFFGSIQRVDLGGKGVWLRLRVGRYASRDSALKGLEALRSKASVRGGKIVPL